MFQSPSSSQHSKTGIVYVFVIANIQSVISQIFRVVGPLEENLNFFGLLGTDIKTNSDHKTPQNHAMLRQSFKTLSE